MVFSVSVTHNLLPRGGQSDQATKYDETGMTTVEMHNLIQTTHWTKTMLQ